MKKIKLNKKWSIIIAIIILIAGYYILKAIFKNPVDDLIIEKVDKGVVLQEVSETGMVKATEEISLGFKSIGKISKINVSVGEKVKRGSILAELDLSYTTAQLQAAKAALDSATTQYNKLINGLPVEDVKLYEDAVIIAKNNLDGIYGNALSIFNDAYDKVYNSLNIVVDIQNSYFSMADQSGIMVSDARKIMDNNLNIIKGKIDLVAKDSSKDNIDSAISSIILSLDSIYNNLKIIRDQCDQGIYYSKVSSVNKASLDTQKAYVNTALATVTTLQNNVLSSRTALQQAENNLSSKTANARPEDIEIYRAQIEQAQANVKAIQSQFNDNYLLSSIDGVITEINIKRGQVVSPSQSIIKMLSVEPFQIKVDIYEQDIVNVKVGDGVKINLVAFPRQSFLGNVLSINPAETIIDNVVYYEVTIGFPTQPDGIRSGMTADISIETYKKDNVLRISKNLVNNINNIETVQVVKGREIKDVTIITGLEGNDYFEIIEGLLEGDRVVSGKK